MTEMQYYKRTDQTISIINILTGQNEGRYFVKVYEHRGWWGSEEQRNTSRDASFANKVLMDAHVEAFIKGLVDDGYVRQQNKKGTLNHADH